MPINGDKTGLKQTILKTLSGLTMTAETYKYNRSNELIKKTNTLTNKSTTYTYDKNGNTTSDGLNFYFWDGHNQLIKLTRPDGAQISYTYDGQGRRRTKAITTTSSGDTGRGTRDDSRVTGKKVHSSTQTTTYSYDGIKLQYQANPDNSTTRFNYDVDGNLVSFTKSARAEELKAEALKGGGTGEQKPVFAREQSDRGNLSSSPPLTKGDQGGFNAQSSSSQTFYYHLNGHQDIKSITDNQGHELASYSYDCWGRVIAENGTLAYSQPFRYASYYWDTDSSQYYLIARYYQPKLGRFLSRDPLIGSSTRPLSQNRYVYCENDPVNKSDPSGRWGVYVHYDLSKVWAVYVGFSANEATTIAKADKAVDTWGKDRSLHYEAVWPGASWWAYYWFFPRAVLGKNISHLGSGLHCVQDKWAHDLVLPKNHKPWMDVWTGKWPEREKKTRSESITFLDAYLVAVGRK